MNKTTTSETGYKVLNVSYLGGNSVATFLHKSTGNKLSLSKSHKEADLIEVFKKFLVDSEAHQINTFVYQYAPGTALVIEFGVRDKESLSRITVPENSTNLSEDFFIKAFYKPRFSSVCIGSIQGPATNREIICIESREEKGLKRDLDLESDLLNNARAITTAKKFNALSEADQVECLKGTDRLLSKKERYQENWKETLLEKNKKFVEKHFGCPINIPKFIKENKSVISCDYPLALRRVGFGSFLHTVEILEAKPHDVFSYSRIINVVPADESQSAILGELTQLAGQMQKLLNERTDQLIKDILGDTTTIEAFAQKI